jgi:glutamyl-tRNA reductase
MAGIKYDPNEDYTVWVERVRTYEYGIALQRIAEGEPIEKILEDMARRVSDKCVHPYLLKINEIAKEEAETKYDLKNSAQSYKENYLDKFGPKADHVVDDNIKVNNSGK